MRKLIIFFLISAVANQGFAQREYRPLSYQQDYSEELEVLRAPYKNAAGLQINPVISNLSTSYKVALEQKTEANSELKMRQRVAYQQAMVEKLNGRLRHLKAVKRFATYNIIAGSVFFTAGTYYTIHKIVNPNYGDSIIDVITIATVGGGTSAVVGGIIWRKKTNEKIKTIQEKLSINIGPSTISLAMAL